MRIKKVIMSAKTFTIIAQEILGNVRIGDNYYILESLVMPTTSDEYLKFTVEQIEVSDNGSGFTVTLTAQDDLQERINKMDKMDIRKFIGKKIESVVE